MSMENNDNNRYPRVSVIVPVKNAEKTIEKLLAALSGQDYPAGLLQIIIVDNGSTDGTPDIIRKYPFALEHENKIAGSYAARNKGLSVADGEMIAFTDSDCVPEKDWVRTGVRALLENNAGMAGGKVSFVLPEPPSAAEIIDSLTHMQNEDNIRNRRRAVTANLFVRKTLFDEVGLFAEAESGEDFNWTSKAVQQGFALVYAPDAVIHHPARKMRELMEKSRRTAMGSFSKALQNQSYFRNLFDIANKLVPVPSRRVSRFLIANPKVLLKKGLAVWGVSYLIKLNQLKGMLSLIFEKRGK